MQVDYDPDDGSLERLRPAALEDWQFVASGFWSTSPMHAGFVEYFLADIGAGVWLLDRVQRAGCLDGLTAEDIDAGELTDDQLQALWGTTLAEAQARSSRIIVARLRDFKGAPEDAARLLYEAVCASGGLVIEDGGSAGLVEP